MENDTLCLMPLPPTLTRLDTTAILAAYERLVIAQLLLPPALLNPSADEGRTDEAPGPAG